MTENYSFKNKIMNYSRGIVAAGLLAASGCATSNHSNLDSKINSANIPTTSAKKDVPYKAVVTLDGIGISVDFDSCKDLLRNTGKAIGSLAYGITMPIHPYHNTADGKKIWAPGFRVIKYPEHSVIRSFLPSSYKAGECAQTLGLDFDWLALTYLVCKGKGGDETVPEGKVESVPTQTKTYEKPKEKPTQQGYVPPVNPPVNPPESDGDGRITGY